LSFEKYEMKEVVDYKKEKASEQAFTPAPIPSFIKHGEDILQIRYKLPACIRDVTTLSLGIIAERS